MLLQASFEPLKKGTRYYEKARKLEKAGKRKEALAKYVLARDAFAVGKNYGILRNYEKFLNMYSYSLEKTGRYMEAMVYRERIVRDYKNRNQNASLMEEKTNSFANMLLRIAKALEKRQEDEGYVQEAKYNPVFYYQKVLLLNEYTGRQVRQAEVALKALYRLRPDIAVMMVEGNRLAELANKMEASKREDLSESQKKQYALNIRLAEQKLYEVAYGRFPDANIYGVSPSSLTYGCEYSVKPRILTQGSLTNGHHLDGNRWDRTAKVEVVVTLGVRSIEMADKVPNQVAYGVSKFRAYVHADKSGDVKAPAVIMAYSARSRGGPWVLSADDLDVPNESGWVEMDAKNHSRARYVKFVFVARETNGKKAPMIIGEIDVIK
jgi:hypothetical protein